jgi:bifunctional enzyme CysN/CysC
MTDTMPLLRLATAGSVDDGKSTLIGRLLLDAKLILEDQMDALNQRQRNGAPDLASITDGLRAEREQGITIDVAYRYFATPRRSFIIADTPGHERYTRNMVTGASTADLAIVLIDARNGLVEQSRRHTYLASLLGIRHIVAAVNKMDLVGWDEARFRSIEAEFAALAGNLGVADARAFPISALNGDNVVDPGGAEWYDGPALLPFLEHIDTSDGRAERPFRLPIQSVLRPPEGDARDLRRYAGQIAAGTVRPGDEIVALPSGGRTTIAGVETLDGADDEASAPDSIAVQLADDLDIGRGELLSAAEALPATGREVEAMLCWFAEEALVPGGRYTFKHTTRSLRSTVDVVHSRVDLHTLEEGPAPATLELNDIARVTLRLAQPIAADAYAENRATGAFILIDDHSNDTVAGGMILQVRSGEAAVERSPDVTWHETGLGREERWRALGAAGATVWLTGLPASGKSTIAAVLERLLVEAGRPAYLLDGDNVRHGLSGDLGFSPSDRRENIRRVAHVARLFADGGSVAIVSLVSPAAADRTLARELHAAAGLPFIEVHVDTPVEVCAARDPKGLYARAFAGELRGLTGVNAPYEPPLRPDVLVRGAEETVEGAARRLLEALDAAVGR